MTKRGQGIASQLMKQQHEHIKTLGFHKVRTYGRNTRKAMLITNLKHGFDILSTFSDEKEDIKLYLKNNRLRSSKHESIFSKWIIFVRGSFRE